MTINANALQRPTGHDPCYNPDAALIPANYDNANIQYIGRWNTSGTTGNWSGWTGARFVFKIRYTGTLQFECQVNDQSAADNLSIVVAVDGSASTTKQSLTTVGETFTGVRISIFTIPNDGAWHYIEVYMYCLGSSQFAVTNQSIIKSITVGCCAEVATWTLGSTKLQCIGDSWMTADASWIRLLDSSTYNIYPVSNTGYKCSDANTNYLYDYTSVLNSDDPTPDKVLISFGVNDYNAGVTVPNFQTALLALIDKVRGRWASVPIYLVRVPSNTGAGKTFGQYGVAMLAAAGLRSNTTYIDTTSFDASAVFQNDDNHLTPASLLAFAQFVQPLIA